MNESAVFLSLAEIARRLDGAGIAWAVFAGAAATVYGVTRPITDVDILIPAAAGDQAAALFPEAQVLRPEGGAVWLLKLPGADLVAGLQTVDLDAARKSEVGSIKHEVGGTSAFCLHTSYFGSDWQDVVAMMTYLPTLDWDYLHWRATTGIPQPRREQVLRRLAELWQKLAKE